MHMGNIETGEILPSLKNKAVHFLNNKKARALGTFKTLLALVGRFSAPEWAVRLKTDNIYAGFGLVSDSIKVSEYEQ